MDREKEGQRLFSQAEKKSKGTWFSKPEWDQAAELFKQSAIQYKVDHIWEKSGNAQIRAAECYINSGQKFNYSQALIEASRSYRHLQSSPQMMEIRCNCLKKAILSLIEQNRFFLAARIAKDFAVDLENNLKFDMAIEFYQQAHDLFISENHQNNALDCLYCIAKILSSKHYDQYIEAAELLLNIGRSRLENSKGIYSARTPLFESILCFLTAYSKAMREVDMEYTEKCQDLIETYFGKIGQFNCHREAKLLEGLLNALQTENSDQVSNCSLEYDSILRINDWEANILLIIKESLTPNLC